MISFRFPSDWLRERRKFSGLITEWSKVKLVQSWITFDTELIVALKGTLVAKHIKNVHFTKQCYLYHRCWSSLQDQHFTEKGLQLIEELHCWNTFAVQADNQSLVIARDTPLKKPGKWKPNKYFLLDCMGFILSLLHTDCHNPPSALMFNLMNMELLILATTRMKLNKNYWIKLFIPQVPYALFKTTIHT